MTPTEFRAVVAGYERRQEIEWERAAWIVSHMYAMHITRKGKKPPTIDKLLGRKPKAKD